MCRVPGLKGVRIRKCGGFGGVKGTVWFYWHVDWGSEPAADCGRVDYSHDSAEEVPETCSWKIHVRMGSSVGVEDRTNRKHRRGRSVSMVSFQLRHEEMMLETYIRVLE